MLFHLIIMELKSSNSKASDRVQSKRPTETPGFLISLILNAAWSYINLAVLLACNTSKKKSDKLASVILFNGPAYKNP